MCLGICQHTLTYDSIRQHTSAYVSIRQHTSAYVSIQEHVWYLCLDNEAVSAAPRAAGGPHERDRAQQREQAVALILLDSKQVDVGGAGALPEGGEG
jgi:hypothetical protein